MKYFGLWLVGGSHKNFKKKIEFPYLHNGMKIENVCHVSWLMAVYEWTSYFCTCTLLQELAIKIFESYFWSTLPRKPLLFALTESDKIFISLAGLYLKHIKAEENFLIRIQKNWSTFCLTRDLGWDRRVCCWLCRNYFNKTYSRSMSEHYKFL